jgi:hypothetical protein
MKYPMIAIDAAANLSIHLDWRSGSISLFLEMVLCLRWVLTTYPQIYSMRLPGGTSQLIVSLVFITYINSNPCCFP